MNAFEQFATAAIPQPVRTKMARRDARTIERVETARREKDALSRAYRVARQRWIDETLQQPQGDNFRAMMRWIDRIGIDDADMLIEEIRRATWLREAGADLRYLAVDLIAERIIAIREEAGLAPFEDPMPGEPPGAFQIILKLLSGP